MNQNPDNNPGGTGQTSNRSRPAVDKTIVEGPDAVVPLSSTMSGTRLNATRLGATNPYAKHDPTLGGLLPSGTEPTALGSGTVVGLLGAGGMARVYKIWNEKLEVFRAVKILIPSQQSDLLNRFETEAKITAKLHHPNIVEIYSVGDYNGLPYLEMEYIDGQSLEALIQAHGKLPDAVCSSIGLSVASALAYAHSQEFLLYGKTYNGVIHRDLKPANIMISRQGQVKLMDFGIARPTEASLHTVDGNIVGTMQYLSPEQLDGVDIDRRTDIYSFGAILYELLTGTKTFPQETITNLMRKKITNEYRKFSEFDFSVPRSLAHVAQKCLELRKEDRYANAEALLEDLQAAHAELTSESPAEVMKAYAANPASVALAARRRLPKWLTLWVPIGAGALVLIAAVVAGVAFFSSRPAPRAQKPTPAPAAQPTPAPAPLPPVTPLPDAAAASAGSEVRPLAAVQTSAPTQRTGASAVEQSKPTRRLLIDHSREPEPPRREPTANKPADRPAAPPAKPSSPVDAVKTKYRTGDLVTAGLAAVEARAFGDAIVALENAPPDHPKATLRVLLLLEAYVETGRINDAQALITGSPINDAQYDVLCGRTYQALGKNKKALDLYQSAMLKPSIVRDVKYIRQDALYFTATVWTEHYLKNPSADSRMQTVNAWLVVKRMYTDSPSHPRFLEANAQLSKIQ